CKHNDADHRPVPDRLSLARRGFRRRHTSLKLRLTAREFFAGFFLSFGCLDACLGLGLGLRLRLRPGLCLRLGFALLVFGFAPRQLRRGFLARSLLGFEARLLRRLAFRLGLGFALAILLFLARHLRLEPRLLSLELRFHFGFALRSLLGLLVFLLPCLGGLFQRHAAQLR